MWTGAAAGLAVTALVVGAVAEAATGTPPAPVRVLPAAARTPAPAASLQADFTAAAAEFHVPLSVLMAVSYQETLWESHQGEPSSTGNYNVMGLTSVGPADLTPISTAEKLADRTGAAGDPGGTRASARASAGAAAAAKSPAAKAAAAKALTEFESVDTTSPALHTLDAAAALLKQPDSALRGQIRQSVRGGAALLASYEKQSEGVLPTDPGRWYAAVAQYSQGSDAATQEQFADRVYTTVAAGVARTTGDNQAVVLAADPAVKPVVPTALSGARGTVTRNLAGTPTAAKVCEAGPSSCAFVSAATGNYDPANRPTDGDTIRDIVVHTTESSASSAINTFTNYNPALPPVSSHFVVAATGAVTQLVRTEDVAFQADNKTVNQHSVGVEAEGYALTTGSWVAEQEYQSVAAVVKDLATKYQVPLDREHVIGHDDVPYVTGDNVTTQHYDPGPYWDWGHFMSLLGAAPLDGNDLPVIGGTVTIAPDYATNKPVLTGCASSACVAHSANFVYLHTTASSSSPLIGDALLTSVNMKAASTDGADVSDKADYGQSFVVADLSADGDWTAIWYGGQKAWFYNPGGVNSYANSDPTQQLVSPKNGTAIPVYGRAYPEAAAYTTAGVPADVQQLVALPKYTILPNQAYTTTGSNSLVAGDFFDYDDNGCTTAACKVVIGTTQYYEIRYNHRLAYVMASDVQTIKPKVPPTGTYVPVTPTRIMDTRHAVGVPLAPLKSGKTVSLQVTGTPGGIPANGVTSVVMNVTAVAPTSGGFLTVYPDGRKTPLASNLNFGKGVSIANLVTVPVLDGKVDFYGSATSVDVLADLVGYYTTDSTAGSGFVPVAPKWIMDTRSGAGGVAKAPVPAGHTITLQVTGTPTAPVQASGVTAVVLNVTAVKSASHGFVSVYPDDPANPQNLKAPSVSNLQYPAGASLAELVVVPVVDGKVNFYNSSGSLDLAAGLTGYYTSGAGSVFHSVGPVRVMDTRFGTGVRSGPLGTGGVLPLQLGNHNGVPLNATAVVLNVTALNGTKGGYVSVYPYGPSLPSVSSLNYAKAAAIANLVVVPVTDGKVDFYNNYGDVDLFADLAGYYTG